MKAKKIAAVCMAAVLAMVMAVPVMADADFKENRAETNVIMPKASAGILTTGSNYSITIEWTTTAGAYTITGDTYKWDAETMSFVRTSQGTGTTGNSVAQTTSITVTNQSDDSVDYEISYSNYAGSTETATTETAASGTKTGTLASGSSSATYEGNVALTNYKSDSYGSDSLKTGTYTVTVSEHVPVAVRTLEMRTETTLTSTALLATAEDAFTFTTTKGCLCTLYLGYIPATAYADYNDAEAFIDELNGEGTNTTKIVPPGATEPETGYWRLFEDADTLYFEIVDEEDYEVGGVSWFWQERDVDHYDDGIPFSFYYDSGVEEIIVSRDAHPATFSSADTGFGIVWVEGDDSNVPVAVRTLENHTETTLTSTALLATAEDAVAFTNSDGYVNIIYQGYISATAYADYNDAWAFIDELNGEGTNTTKIVPTGATDPEDGYWALITDAELDYLEVDEKYLVDEEETDVCSFGSVAILWFEELDCGDHDENVMSFYYSFGEINVYYGWRNYTDSINNAGFAVVWFEFNTLE